MKQFLLYILLISFSLSFGQKVNVNYKHYISDSENYTQAKNSAINQAKLKALRKAGIEESISSFSFLNTVENSTNLEEYFENSVHTELKGSIKDYKVISEKKGYDANLDRFYIDLDLSVEVIKYKTKRDRDLTLDVKGLKDSYKTGESLNITVTPSKDGYLKVFYLNKNKASMFYPLKPENQNDLIIEGKEVELERGKEFSISYLQVDADSIETGQLIFVYTKEKETYSYLSLEDLYYTKTNVKDIFKYIYSIELNNRIEIYKNFLITN